MRAWGWLWGLNLPAAGEGPGRGGAGRGNTWKRGGAGQSDWAGLPKARAESERRLSGSRGLPLPSRPPRRGPRLSCLRSSWGEPALSSRGLGRELPSFCP